MIETGLRIAFSLAVVFALMWGIAKVVRRPLAGRSGELLSVLTRQQLTRNSSVAVVRVADRALVVGITDNQISLLGETDLAAIDPQAALAAAPASSAAAAHPALSGITAAASPALSAAAAAPTARRGAVRLVSEEMPELSQVAALRADQLPVAAAGRLAGSALSPQTWSATIEFLRSRTARK